MKQMKKGSEATLTIAEAMKLGMRPSPPPRPKTYSTRETKLTQHAPHESEVDFSLYKKTLIPARNFLKGA
jgi:hypothetical protein